MDLSVSEDTLIHSQSQTIQGLYNIYFTLSKTAVVKFDFCQSQLCLKFCIFFLGGGHVGEGRDRLT